MTARASDHHIEDRWLPYLEGLLSPEENRELEDHLLECRDCASRLEEMGQWASLVRSNRQAICPEGWELLQYERTGEDPLGIIALHVEICAQCGAELKSFEDHTVKQGVPRDLWEKMERLQGEPLPRSRGGHRAERLANLLESMKDLFRPIVLVPAAVAAMVLVLSSLLSRGSRHVPDGRTQFRHLGTSARCFGADERPAARCAFSWRPEQESYCNSDSVDQLQTPH